MKSHPNGINCLTFKYIIFQIWYDIRQYFLPFVSWEVCSFIATDFSFLFSYTLTAMVLCHKMKFFCLFHFKTILVYVFHFQYTVCLFTIYIRFQGLTRYSWQLLGLHIEVMREFRCHLIFWSHWVYVYNFGSICYARHTVIKKVI